jgi:hypothetical protein
MIMELCNLIEETRISDGRESISAVFCPNETSILEGMHVSNGKLPKRKTTTQQSEQVSFG